MIHQLPSVLENLHVCKKAGLGEGLGRGPGPLVGMLYHQRNMAALT